MPLLATVIAVAIVSLTACSRAVEPLPAACLAGPDAIRAALARAPGAVRLEGGIPLSGCLVKAAGPADVETVGADLVTVAGELGVDARRPGGGAAVTQLGYLLGAVERGAGRTQGIHGELVRRLRLELTGIDVRSAAFGDARRAGHASG